MPSVSPMLTFHKIIAGCEAKKRDAWQAFLREYSPIAFRAFDVYLQRGYPGGRDKFWRESLRLLAENDCERLRKLEHQSEREFLVGLRALLLESAGAGLNARADAPGPGPSVESVRGLLKGLPLLDQQVAFLKLAGYSDAGVEQMLRVAPTAAQKGLERLEAEWGSALGRAEDSCLWPSAWHEVLRQAWSEAAEHCVALRLMVRILDGQVGWYDKTPAEQHLSGCLHCLERFVSLQEVVSWKRDFKPRAEFDVAPWLDALPLERASKSSGSFLKRALFSRKTSSR